LIYFENNKENKNVAEQRKVRLKSLWNMNKILPYKISGFYAMKWDLSSRFQRVSRVATINRYEWKESKV